MFLSAKIPPLTVPDTPRQIHRRQPAYACLSCNARRRISGNTVAIIAGQRGHSTGIVNFRFDNTQKLCAVTAVCFAQVHHDKWFCARSKAGLSAADKPLAIADSHFVIRICIS